MATDDEITRSGAGRIDPIEPGGTAVACLADIHGNTVALDAVLSSAEFATADVVAVLGCVTAGPDPVGVLERLHSLDRPVFYLAGNGERWLLELAAGVRPYERELDHWLVDAHGAAALAELGSWPKGLRAPHRCLDGIRLCHGSPRSDIEILSSITDNERLRQATQGVDEHTVVHGHSHVQYKREAVGKLIVGAGSVGLPYGAGAGARWVLLSDEAHLITTPFDLDEVQVLVDRVRYPSAKYMDTLHDPPTAEGANADAERLRFSN
ncbi:MAG: metallophosphoesterase family protein [Acidimicrobiales bacterium]